MPIAQLDQLLKRIDLYHHESIELQRQITAIPALSPDNGGEGEKLKSDFLRTWVEHNLKPDDLQEYRAPDARVPCGYRPNLVAFFRGHAARRTVWILSHMDVVPPGDLSKWTGDPWIVRVATDNKGRTKLIGRGTEDNQAGLVSSLFAAKAFRDLAVTPAANLGLALVADEETGSSYGIHYLLEHHGDLFKKSDLIIIPDAGDNKGGVIEVAEKSILWLRFHTRGAQTHGSMPERGRNAHKAANVLAVRLETLYKKFSKRDAMFSPPISTFEPTKREANVPNVNTIPGEDVLFFDCRVLPGYRLSEVLREVRKMARAVEKEYRVKIDISSPNSDQAAPPTSTGAPVVQALTVALRELRKLHAQPVGIGGGTVAAFFRRQRIPAAVWSTMDDTAHSPDEYCLVENMIADAQVFAHVCMQT